MSRRILAALALGLGLSAGHAAAQGLTPLSLGEHLALRSYTGQAIGQTLMEVLRLPSVGIFANTSSICAALSGAAASQVLETRRGADFALAAVATPEEAATAAREMTRLIKWRRLVCARANEASPRTPTFLALTPRSARGAFAISAASARTTRRTPNVHLRRFIRQAGL